MFRLSKRYGIHPIILTVVFTLLLIVASAAFGYIVVNLRWFQYFDDYIYNFLQFVWHPHWVEVVVAPFNFNFISWGGPQFLNFLMIIIALALAYIAIFRRRDLSWAVVALIIAGLFQALLAWAIPFLFFRPRPFLSIPTAAGKVATGIWQALPSFPSGHVRDTTLILTVLAAFLPKKMQIPFMLFVVFIAFSRVFVGAHFPTDVIAAMIIGFLAGKIVLSIVEDIKLAREKYRERKAGSSA